MGAVMGKSYFLKLPKSSLRKYSSSQLCLFFMLIFFFFLKVSFCLLHVIFVVISPMPPVGNFLFKIISNGPEESGNIAQNLSHLILPPV